MLSTESLSLAAITLLYLEAFPPLTAGFSTHIVFITNDNPANDVIMLDDAFSAAGSNGSIPFFSSALLND